MYDKLELQVILGFRLHSSYLANKDEEEQGRQLFVSVID